MIPRAHPPPDDERTQESKAAVRDLLESPGWQVVESYLERLRTLAQQQLASEAVTTGDQALYLLAYQRGRLDVLRQLLREPRELVELLLRK